MPNPTPPTIDYNISIDANVGSQRIDYEYDQMLVHQRESSYPFTAFMVKMAQERSLTSTVYWFDTRPAPETDVEAADHVESATNGAAVSVTSTNPKYFKKNDIIEFPNVTPAAGYTNVGFITAVDTSTGVLTVRPHDPGLKLMAGTTADAINILFTSFEQGSTTTVPTLTRPIRGSNTSTILRDSYQVAKTYENERFFGAPERARARAEKEIRHLVDLNKLLLFGKSITNDFDTTYQTNARSTTKGFQNFITTNVMSYGGALTSSGLFDMMTQIHQNSYGADGAMDRRLVFCSSSFLSAINKLTLSGIRFQNRATSWGASVTQIEWAGWTWDLVHDPTLTKFRPGYAFVLQPRYLMYKPYRTTTFRANVQNPENDYVKDEFLTEANFKLRLEEVHGVITP